MLFRNALIENAQTPVDIRVENGLFSAIAPNLASENGEEVRC